MIEPEALPAMFAESNSTNLAILDAREPAPFTDGHLPGAVRVDLAAWKSASLAANGSLEDRRAWRSRIAELGVDSSDRVVIYDDGQMTEAARVWFILQYVGVDKAKIVNGGFSALQRLIREGRLSIVREVETPFPSLGLSDKSGSGPIQLIDRFRVREKIASGEAQVLDARTRAEFEGRDERGNSRAGHIPAAVNLPHTDLLDSQGKLRPAGELAAMFKRAGFERGRPIITHCQSGGRASLAAIAALRAGFGPVSNYYLSFGDWAADATCPIETPSTKAAAEHEDSGGQSPGQLETERGTDRIKLGDGVRR